VPPGETSYRDARDHFLALCPAWQQLLDDWRNDDRYCQDVVPFVQSFAVSALYQITPHDVEQLGRETVHALGRVERHVAESVPAIGDWNPRFALQHTLHFALQHQGALPTYQAFRDFCRTNPQARSMLGQPATRKVTEVVESGAVDPDRAFAAMRWRVGLAYYSFLKEVYVVATLREAGIYAQYHPLADVLFRVDCWAGSTALHLYVENPKYRAGEEGRKPRPMCPQLRTVTLELPPRRVFGAVHLPDRSDILAAWRQAAGGP
jgi:hypothetical protein